MNEQQQIYYAKLHRKARRQRRSIREALAWLDARYTGETRKAFAHQRYSPSWMTTVELQLRQIYRLILQKTGART